jgi:hypothetical protein
MGLTEAGTGMPGVQSRTIERKAIAMRPSLFVSNNTLRPHPQGRVRWHSQNRDLGLLPHRPAQLTQPVDDITRIAGVAHSVEHVSGLSVLHVTEFFADLSERDSRLK